MCVFMPFSLSWGLPSLSRLSSLTVQESSNACLLLLKLRNTHMILQESSQVWTSDSDSDSDLVQGRLYLEYFAPDESGGSIVCLSIPVLL